MHHLQKPTALAAALGLVAATLGLAVPATAAPAATAPAEGPSSFVSQADCDLPDFPDNPEGTPFYEAVRWAQCSGLVHGYKDGTMGMRQDINRNEVAQITYRYRAPDHTAPEESPFPDVEPGTTYYEAVTWLASTGIVQGFKDGTWGGWNPMVRGHMASLVHGYTGASWGVPHLNPFTDLAFDSPSYDHITWVSANEIAYGYNDGTFKPYQNITRAEMAVMLHRLHLKDGTYLTQAPADYRLPDCSSDCARWTTANVNQRHGPGSEFPSHGVVPQGTQLTKVNQNGDWAYVRSPQYGYGWMHRDYLEIAPQGPQYPMSVYGTLREGESAFWRISDQAIDRDVVRVDQHGLWLSHGGWTLDGLSYMIASSGDSVVTERNILNPSGYQSTVANIDAFERYDPNASQPEKDQMAYNRVLVTDRDGVRTWSYRAGLYAGNYVQDSGTQIIGGDYKSIGGRALSRF